MPNDSRSRRDKKEKEKKKNRKDRSDPVPLLRELPAEEAEATSTDVDGNNYSEDALAISVSLLGAKPSSKAMDFSFSAFASLSSAAEGKDSLEDEGGNSFTLSRRQ